MATMRAEVELVARRLRVQQVERGVDVLVGARIAAAFLVDPAVFDVPDGDALAGQRAGQVAHLLDAAELDGPAAAVHQHGDRKRAGAGRAEQFGELRRRAAVGDSGVGAGPVSAR